MEPTKSSLRKPLYLSPSALSCFEDKPDEYYVRYLAPSKSPKDPQTKPMAAGSAFDAYIKSHLHKTLFGDTHKDSNKYQLDALIVAQVESHNRDWARNVGQYLFNIYENYGCVADLMTSLSKSAIDPSFEFSVQGVVETPDGMQREGVTRQLNGVPLLGKPDVFYATPDGHRVVRDFKVNGYCSIHNTSPKPGYVKTLPDRKSHKDCMPSMVHGIMVNISCYLEQVDQQWADQLATYAWLLGEPVGRETIMEIDQLCCKGGSSDGLDMPTVRVACHRSRVSEAHQYKLLGRYQNLWDIVNSEPFYFFRDRSFEESRGLCELLDKRAIVLFGELTDDDRWLATCGQEQ